MRRSRLLVECLLCIAALWILGAPLALASRTYTVQKGDTYWSIARKFSVSQYAVAYSNKSLGNKPLQVGARITVPDKSFKVPAHKAQIVSGSASVRTGPAVGARKLGSLARGERIWVSAVGSGWCKVGTSSGVTGWIAGDYVSPALSSGTPRAVASTPFRHKTRRYAANYSHHSKRRYASYASHRRSAGYPQPPIESSEVSDEVVRTALAYRGARYRYGGTSRGGFDCSGFTRHVYGKHGVRLPHCSRAQAGVGQRVSRDELKEGDLVFFHTTRRGISHVGIYAGDGKFIHASTRRGGVRVDSLDAGYYRNRYVGARRIK